MVQFPVATATYVGYKYVYILISRPVEFARRVGIPSSIIVRGIAEAYEAR